MYKSLVFLSLFISPIICINGSQLKMSFDALSSSVGGASVVGLNGAISSQVNPASVSSHKSVSLFTSNSILSLDRYMNSIFISKSISRNASVSLYYTQFGTGDIQTYDYMNNPQGEVSTQQGSGALVFGQRVLSSLSVGVAVKGYRNKIIEGQQGTGAGFDVGMLYKTSKYSFGIALYDISADYSWRIDAGSDMVSSYTEDIPSSISIGVSYLVDNVNYLIQYDFSSRLNYGINDCIRLGLIWDIRENFDIRCGVYSINKFLYNENILNVVNVVPSLGTEINAYILNKNLVFATSVSYDFRVGDILSTMTIGIN